MPDTSHSSGHSMGKVFARVTFIPSLILNVALDRVTTRTWYNAIDSTVILGALPFKSMKQELVQTAGVKAVVSMNEDYELRHSISEQEWSAAGVEFLQLSTVDMFEAPSQEKLRRGVSFILKYCQQQFAPPPHVPDSNGASRVYVHCKAGRTRSATLVACYLMQVYGMAPGDAVEHMTRARPHIWLGSAQHLAIQKYYDSLQADRAAAALEHH